MIKDRRMDTKFTNEDLSTSIKMSEKVDEIILDLKSTKYSLDSTQIIT